jgi:peptidyl-tRNA hydrolase
MFTAIKFMTNSTQGDKSNLPCWKMTAAQCFDGPVNSHQRTTDLYEHIFKWMHARMTKIIVDAPTMPKMSAYWIQEKFKKCSVGVQQTC